MNPCRPFTADLNLLAAGVLPPDGVRAAEAHLAGCAACREQHEWTLALCAELSMTGKAAEPPDAAAWRLRNRVRTTITGTATITGRRWQLATAAVVAVACGAWFVQRATPPADPPRPLAVSSTAPADADPPLTLLACERAAACSDAALDQMFSRDAARPHTTLDEQRLRAFAPLALFALEQND